MQKKTSTLRGPVITVSETCLPGGERERNTFAGFNWKGLILKLENWHSQLVKLVRSRATERKLLEKKREKNSLSLWRNGICVSPPCNLPLLIFIDKLFFLIENNLGERIIQTLIEEMIKRDRRILLGLDRKIRTTLEQQKVWQWFLYCPKVSINFLCDFETVNCLVVCLERKRTHIKTFVP